MRASCVAKFQMLSQLEQPSLSLSQLACPLFQHLDHIAATLFTHSATMAQQRTSRTHRKGTAGSISETSSSGSSFVFFFFPKTDPRAFWHQTDSLAPEPPESRKAPLPPSYAWQFAWRFVSFSLPIQNYCIWQTLATVCLPNIGVNQLCEAVFA